MVSVIQTVTVISQPGVRRYSVGEEGIIRIADESQKLGSSLHTFYVGYDESGNPVFRLENAPVAIDYTQVLEGSFRTLIKGRGVTIRTDAVDQESQEPLDGEKGFIVQVNNEQEIIVRVGKKNLPLSISELVF